MVVATVLVETVLRQIGEESRISLLAALLQQLGDQRGPAGLMAGAQARAVVAVEFTTFWIVRAILAAFKL